MLGAKWLAHCIQQEITFLMDRSLLLPVLIEGQVHLFLTIFKSVKGKIGVCSVIQNNGMLSGARGLNRLCLLLISGRERFSFKGLFMCRQLNISSAHLPFPSLNCISSFTVNHLPNSNKSEHTHRSRLILLSFLLFS